jgi:hypothetical protein
MIKKLRNQPHAPKWEQAPKCGSKRKKKTETILVWSHINLFEISGFISFDQLFHKKK